METVHPFTAREMEVIRLLLQGKSNKQIAFDLNISKSTVEFHLKNIYRKLEVNSRAEVILHLSKHPLLESIGSQSEGNLWQPVGENNPMTEYSSQAKHFFDPQEEQAMKNRTLISISLSVIALVVAIGAFVYLRLEGVDRGEPPSGNQQMTPVHTPRGILPVPPEASTRYYDEVLLILSTPRPPFQYAAVFATTDCFVSAGSACAFTSPISFTGDEGPIGPVYWMPDGENGLYVRGNQILVINHLERVNGRSDVLVPEILKPHSQINISPDGRWLVEAIETQDPYTTDLVLIKTSSGRINKLDIGLEECFKSPLGWITPTKFMFRCDVSTGPTPKKFRTEQRFYTYDVMSEEPVELASGMDIGYDALSPDGKYAVYYEKQNGYHVLDLSSGQIYPASLPSGQVVWAQNSNRIAIFADNGDVYVANFDGSSQQKIYSTGGPGYLSMRWFPDHKHIALIGYFHGNEEQPQTILLSTDGEVIDYDMIPTTSGYNIIDISPLPALQR